jgi:hypothetical protein
MRNVSFAALCLLPAIVAGCGQGKPQVGTNRQLPGNYVKGSFVINVEDKASSKDDLAAHAHGVARELGCSAKDPERIDWGDQAGSGVLSSGLANTFHVLFEGCDVSREGTAQLAERLGEGSGVLAAAPEAAVAVSPREEDDPLKGQQDHLALIRRDKACEIAERSGEVVVVAVVDTGVDLDHPDLKDVLYRDARGEVIGANFVGSRSSMPANRDFDDRNGHGTHVAGLVAAAANNGQGVVGVGSCANVRIMPIRVLGDNGAGSSIEIERGVKWAADHGAQIVNLSLGYLAQLGGRGGLGFRSALYDDLAARNVVVLAAAGNDGVTLGQSEGGGYWYNFPSSYDNVIAVAATSRSGGLASFSNRGDKVDIAAPGSQLLATRMGGGYVRMSGTSMATPVAAGAYALALATARAGLDRSLDRIDQRLAQELLAASKLGGVSLGAGEVASGGVVDAEKLTAAMKTRFPKPVEPAEPAEPADSAQPALPPQVMSFAGLASGDAADWPQSIALQNLPPGTRSVYLFWGNSPYAFSHLAVEKAGQTSLEDESRWYFYGTETLTAIAVGEGGKILQTLRIRVKGH